MPKFSANLSLLFPELPFLDRFEAAAAVGFKAVEFWFPYDHSIAEIQRQLSNWNLKCVVINSPPGDVSTGDWGVAIYGDRQDEFRRGMRTAIEYALALECKNVHVMAGVRLSGSDVADDTDTYTDNLRYACNEAAAFGLRVLIEPLNQTDRPNYFLSSMSQAQTIVQASEADNLYVMMDLYHVQMSEGNLASKLRQYIPIIGHIQIADVPGRHQPGTGELNYPFLLDFIDHLRYTGWIGCEYLPSGSTAHSLNWMHRYG